MSDYLMCQSCGKHPVLEDGKCILCLDDEVIIRRRIQAYEKLASPGVTFSDEQKQMIQERLKKEQEDE